MILHSSQKNLHEKQRKNSVVLNNTKSYTHSMCFLVPNFGIKTCHKHHGWVKRTHKNYAAFNHTNHALARQNFASNPVIPLPSTTTVSSFKAATIDSNWMGLMYFSRRETMIIALPLFWLEVFCNTLRMTSINTSHISQFCQQTESPSYLSSSIIQEHYHIAKSHIYCVGSNYCKNLIIILIFPYGKVFNWWVFSLWCLTCPTLMDVSKDRWELSDFMFLHFCYFFMYVYGHVLQ